MTFLTVLFCCFLTFFATQKSSSSPSLLKIESSALGLRASSREELQAWMLNYYLKPQDRHIFYSILQARYFDYSPVLLSICEVIDDRRLKKIISDLKNNNLPDQLIADCICKSAKNGPWLTESDLIVNPLISKHFNPQEWKLSQIYQFLCEAAADSQEINAKIRWESPLKSSSILHLSVYFGTTTQFWKTIRFNAIKDSSTALFIAKSLFYDTNPSDIHDQMDILTCKMILFGLISKKFRESQLITQFTMSIYNRFEKLFSTTPIQYKMDHSLYKLVFFLKRPNVHADYLFIHDFLRIIAPICAPAIVLNVLELFADVFKAERFNLLFDLTCHLFFHGNILFPTVTETCVLLEKTKPERLLKVIYDMDRELLLEVFEECPDLLPNKAIREMIPLQQRLQQSLRTNRKLIEADCSLSFKLPLYNQEPLDKLKLLTQELETILPKLQDNFKPYNYPVIERDFGNLDKKKSFVLAIDCFFDSFMNCEDSYHVLEDGSIIPSLVKFQFYETFGFFLGSALILQHPLRFRLNEFYFNLLRSAYKPDYIHFLTEIHPKDKLSEIPLNVQSRNLKEAVDKINSGLLLAFKAGHFKTDELYKLLFTM